MSENFDSKIAVVTGGASGIGKAISKKLASSGCHVVILDLNATDAEELTSEICDEGGSCDVRECDVSDSASVAQALAPLLESSRIDILVNNAGVAHVGNIENTSEADLERLFRINVKGVFNVTRQIIPTMASNGGGVILNLASIASSVGIADRFAYSMSKGAVRSMTMSIARDYVDANIRCNCVSPARVHTPFVDGFLRENYPDNIEEAFSRLAKGQPIGRMGTPDEVADLVSFLCSDRAAFITGSDIPIDGGFISINN